jgi:hypothetical protein
MENNKRKKNIRVQLIQSIENSDNSNVDAYIYVEDRIYYATFFTIRNVEGLMHRWMQTGETKSFSHFFATDCLIVDKLDQQQLEAIVEELVENGTLAAFFPILLREYTMPKNICQRIDVANRFQS